MTTPHRPWAVFVVFFLILSCSNLTGESPQGADTFVDRSTFSVKDAPLFIKTASTETGFPVQKAPLSYQQFDWLVMGAGPATVSYSFVGEIHQFYESTLRQRIATPDGTGVVTGNATISMTIGKPSPSQLNLLPAALGASVEGLKFTVAEIWGQLNKSAFQFDGDTFFQAQCLVGTPNSHGDGTGVVPYTKIERSLLIYFNHDAEISGTYTEEGWALHFNQVAVKEGWNLLGLPRVNDTDGVFSGTRNVVVVAKDAPVFYAWFSPD